MSKVLVTGGAGFIGSHLVDALVEKGHEVVVLDNLSTGKRENVNGKALFHEADICDYEKIEPFFKGVDFVFHLAAKPRVPVSVKDPVSTTQVNISGTVNVFTAAKEAKVKRVIFASSSSVYGDQEEFPLREDMTPKPKSPYALQKLVGEKFAKLFTELYNIPIISLRFFCVYGPRLLFDSDYSLVLGKFLKFKKQGEPLTIFGDGEQTRGFCYVSDIVKACVLAMSSEKLQGGEVINTGGDRAVSVNYLADLIGGQKVYLEERKGDVKHTKADISKAKELLGWSPEVSFEQGVEKTQEWFSKL